MRNRGSTPCKERYCRLPENVHTLGFQPVSWSVGTVASFSGGEGTESCV